MKSISLGWFLGWLVADIVRGSMNPYTPVVLPVLGIICLVCWLTPRAPDEN